MLFTPIKTSNMKILNPSHDKEFKENGYFIIENFFSSNQIEDLYTYYKSLAFEESPELTSSIKLSSFEKSTKISNHLNAYFSAALNRYFQDYQIGSGVFIMKGSGEASVSSLHQDCNVVDERKYTSVTLWCPLIDVNEENGCLQVIPKSHKWFSVIRSFNTPSYFVDFELVADRLKALPIKKGSVVVFAHSLIHGSKPNYSGVYRPVASFSLTSANAKPIHYILNKNKFQVCVADEDFFFNKSPKLFAGETDIGANIIDEFDCEDEHLFTKELVLKALKENPL